MATDPAPVVTVPLDLLERMVREMTRLADIASEAEAFHREALPHLKRLREIEDAQTKARAKADAEVRDGLALWRKFLFSPLVVAIATGLGTVLGTYLLGSNGIAPQAVKDGISAAEESTDATP